MSAIQQMQNASVINGKMIRQAMNEARGDATQMAELKTFCDGADPSQFSDAKQLDKLVTFVIQYYQDTFEFRPNTSDPKPRQAHVDEARITKVNDVVQDIVRRPNPPPARGRYRDPLNLTGTAEAGSKVKFYNASEPGRPPLGTADVDAHGRWHFELTDESKFEFGDQIGVVVKDSGGESKPVVVPTEPFQVTNTTLNFRNHAGGPITETQVSSSQRALQPKTDNRNPFFTDDNVDKRFEPPREPGEPYRLTLTGGDDAVEPNSTISVIVGDKEFKTKADDLGKFALKIEGFDPGDRIKVRVTDLNDKGIDVDYQAPDVQFAASNLTSGVLKPPQNSRPAADQVVGDGPPWVHFKAANVTVPNGAVMLKNRSTDEVYELKADNEGKINAAVGGIENFDVLDMVARDANGNLSPDSHVAVMLPEKIARGSGYLVPTDKLDSKEPDITKVLEAIKGPPTDVIHNGKEIAGGPFLGMPDLEGLPPFAQLAVVRDGEVIQSMRADQRGALTGNLLRGVHAGDQLNFRLLDASGRTFPTEYQGWKVPERGTGKVGDKHIHVDDRPLASCVENVGKGKVDLDPRFLEPFSLKTGGVGTGESNVPLHYRREFFGQQETTTSQATFDFFPTALAEKLGYKTLQAMTLNVDESNGTRRISSGLTNERGNTDSMTLGIDYVLPPGRSTVNMGDPNQPVNLATDLPRVTELIKRSLTLVALAYEMGKEPGDVEYDRPMGVAKTCMGALDILAVNNPEQKDAIAAAAKAGIPAGYNFELIGKDKVLPEGTKDGGAVHEVRSSAISLLDARTALMGAVVGTGKLKTEGQSDYPAPVIESATILMQRITQSNRQTTIAPTAQPLRVKGTAEPGDIVQVYNVSTGNKTLLAEAVAGPDGKFNIISGAKNLQLGDQLAVMTMTDKGDKSALMVIPSDNYLQEGHNQLPKPVKYDTRPPFFRMGATKIERADVGAPRDGGPFWKLRGDELAVEPFSTVTISSTGPDGKKHEKSAQADGEGKFNIEFAAAPRRQFYLTITDKGGQKANTNMSAPSLATGVQGADDAAALAHGVVRLKMGDGTEVRGVVVEHSSRNGPDLSAADRTDGFVDLVVNRKYAYIANNGQEVESTEWFHIKVPQEHASKLDVDVRDSLDVDFGSLETIRAPTGETDIDMVAVGPATVSNRDFGMPDANAE